MTTIDISNIEFLKIKCFLYKYTPPITSTGKAETTLRVGDRYDVPLETQYYSKYDISSFVSSYGFSQNINENSYNWTLTLHDALLTFDVLNQLQFKGPKLSESDLSNLAKYESQVISDKFVEDTNIIVHAKQARGKSEPSLVTQDVNKVTRFSKVIGLRISDLIQTYDIVSLFIYNGIVPVEELTAESFEEVIDGQRIRIVTIKNLSALPTTFAGTFQGLAEGIGNIKEEDLVDEQFLMAETEDGRAFFSNEFNGFVMNKTISKQIGQVDSVSINGNGISRLLGATRRVLKVGVFENDLYTIGELTKPEDISPYEVQFANQDLMKIFEDIFSNIYKIKFKTDKESLPSLSPLSSINNPNPEAIIVTPIQERTIFESSFYDLADLKISADLHTNIFTIPPFLLACVMFDRGFSSRFFKDLFEEFTAIDALRIKLLGLTEGAAKQATQDSLETRTLNTFALQPVIISNDINKLKAYFLKFADVFAAFSPGTQTPYEIFDEIKSKTHFEIFERSNGVFTIRSPQYNNVDELSLINSTNLDVINVQYNESVEHVVSRVFLNYLTDIGMQLSPYNGVAYVNEKLLAQIGLIESTIDANPNVHQEKSANNLQSILHESLFSYAEYFLRLFNAKLKTGQITCNLNSDVEVGKTYFDEKNNKFGYIIGVNKTVSVTGTATMTITLSYVRDAYKNETNEIIFDKLLTLIDLENAYQQGLNQGISLTGATSITFTGQ